MKYFMICDFATITCDRAKVAEILAENEINYSNHNNFLWELDVPKTFGSPFIETIAENIHYLFHNYTDTNSFLLVVRADEYYSTGL